MTVLEDKRALARQDSDPTPDIVVSDGFSQDDTTVLPSDPELGAEEEVPPAYSEVHDRLSLHQTGFDAGAAVTDDGRVDININQTSRQLADILAPTLRNQLRIDERFGADQHLPPPYIPPNLGGRPGQIPPPQLNVVIQIVGSRGDVQPFVALGQVLKNTYGHRVRVATHSTFQKFVEENGLEFFNIGGDPAELMAFMVKNPGLMPGMDALKDGEITKRRKGIEEIVWGCWRSCIESGNGLGPAPRLERKRNAASTGPDSVYLDPAHKPFVADAIIANPPSFAHIHVAEKLGIPLHLMFTMPWSPTRAFPQPLANIQSSNTDPVTTNYVSYALVEMMTWQGLGDVINRFRTKILDLEPLSLLWAPGVITRLRIPYTYCWSPALIPKPQDWGNHIDVAGFYFLNLASNYTPEPDLAAFLAAGPPPIYIGFGSIVVDNPNALTKLIFDAVAETGVRALVSKGWGGLGADSVGIPDGVFMLGNCPHDWLFQHVSAVCHHGGAGTTAAGINAGKPTIVVPFFGDQPFWGAMVARAGAGPDPIPYKKLTAEGLAEAIRMATKPETLARARELGAKIREEKGTDIGAQSFHQHLLVDNLRCTVAPSRVAIWRVRRTKIRLSALAAASLVESGFIQYSDLKLYRSTEYQTEDEPWDPISAVTTALVGDLSTIAMGIADVPISAFRAAHKSPKGHESTEDVTRGEGSKATTASDTASTAPTVGETTESTTADTASIGPSILSESDRQRAAPTNDSTTSLSNSISAASATSTPADRTTQRTRATSSSHPSETPTSPAKENMELAIETGRSINNVVTAGVKTPMNFCLGLARGFRNAPKLYNDDTVRKVEKVSDFESGLKVAGKEFGYGMYDGITGLVTQPLRGAQKEGGIGFLKGVGKGIGGLMLKPAAAFWSIPAYTMAGIGAEVRTRFAQTAENYIIASRKAQGDADLKNSSAEERADIEVRWLTLKDDIKSFYTWRSKEKGKSRDVSPTPGVGQHNSGSTDSVNANEPPRTGWLHTRNMSFEERKALQERKKAWKGKNGANKFVSSLHITENVPTSRTPSSAGEREHAEFEAAIQHAVRETSRGDPVEDARVEQAIRSSIRQIRDRSGSSASDQPPSLDGASILPGLSRYGFRPDLKYKMPFSPDDFEDITDEEYQALIEQAVQLSIAEDQNQAQYAKDMGATHDDNYEEYIRALERSKTEVHPEDSDLKLALKRSETEHGGGEDDEALKLAMEASQADHATYRQQEHTGQDDDDEELKRAIEASQVEQTVFPIPPAEEDPHQQEEELLQQVIAESERAHQEELARASAKMSEEEKIMEYVKQQSLAEEQNRRKGKGAQGTGAAAEDDDEDLKRAIEESMRASGRVGESSGPSGSGPTSGRPTTPGGSPINELP
ncbi:hypothetical protein BX600DRAFT_429805 [Xylariales sp. PMI_506]|nr:hypothetical protein BX600DRAFT_429805 [Xylariales sp. PMI_506]